jgi:hypothetical protein
MLIGVASALRLNVSGGRPSDGSNVVVSKMQSYSWTHSVWPVAPGCQGKARQGKARQGKE